MSAQRLGRVSDDGMECCEVEGYLCVERGRHLQAQVSVKVRHLFVLMEDDESGNCLSLVLCSTHA